MDLSKQLTARPVITSVPCRVDMGGTLDIPTFYLPLSHLKPASLNLALDLRTRVRFSAGAAGQVTISSRGFETATFEQGQAPYSHPMGLMFACVQHFNAHGLHIHIDSASPPRSALGGSSAAAVAILAGLCSAVGEPVDPARLAWLAHYIESSVAGVPCGVQDQLAAAFGGAHLWEWVMGNQGPGFIRHPVCDTPEQAMALNDHILVAYCGIPHVSRDINRQWVDGFIRGTNRAVFAEIIGITRQFFEALTDQNYPRAAAEMNRETRLRLALTPDVLDDTGKKLHAAAERQGCGARFTGAGGGGCLWSVGEKQAIQTLKQEWDHLLADIPDAGLLNTRMDHQGILIH